MPDWFGDKFDSNPAGDFQELVDSVEEGRRYGVPARTPYTKALGEQQLGRGARFDANSNGQRSELVRLQMPQEFSRAWTVHWSVSRERVEVRTGAFENARGEVGRSFLELRWGSGGAQHVAEVDVRFGGCVTLHGSFIEVVAVGADIGAGSVGGIISATVAPGGAAGGQNELTRTVRVGLVLAAATVESAVPPRAVRVLPVFEPNQLVHTLSFTGNVTPIPAFGLGAFRSDASGDAYYYRYGISVPVPPAASVCQLNAGSVALNDAALIYTLAL
jgi:hypothetical protein